MIISKAKSTIKSIPIAYKILFPAVSWIRRRKSAHFKLALKDFRQYCIDLSELVLEPVFVKVGANDGITGDPCSDILLTGNRWKGLLIEPVPYCFNRLKKNFHDTQRFSLEQIAIGSASGKKTFYYVDQAASDNIPDLPYWFDQLGSFDKNHILKHSDGILAPFIVECTIDVSTLSDVLSRNGIRDFHLLHIDAEGYDHEVLKALDFGNHKPLAIFAEHKHLPNAQKKEMLRLLGRHGYSIRDCGQDFFAINKKAYRQLQYTAHARGRQFETLTVPSYSVINKIQGQF